MLDGFRVVVNRDKKQAYLPREDRIFLPCEFYSEVCLNHDQEPFLKKGDYSLLRIDDDSDKDIVLFYNKNTSCGTANRLFSTVKNDRVRSKALVFSRNLFEMREVVSFSGIANEYFAGLLDYMRNNLEPNSRSRIGRFPMSFALHHVPYSEKITFEELMGKTGVEDSHILEEELWDLNSKGLINFDEKWKITRLSDE